MRRAATLILFCFIVSAIILFYQNCGKGVSSLDQNSKTCVMASMVAPTFWVDSIEYNGTPNPLILAQNQNHSFKVTYLGTQNVNCGPTSGNNYWLLPDNSKIYDYCVTLNNVQTGNYAIQWFTSHLPDQYCFSPGEPPSPLVTTVLSINFTAQ